VRLTLRGSLVSAGVVIALALIGIGGLLVVQAIRPHISVEEANRRSDQSGAADEHRFERVQAGECSP
jgi:hypothetical protein